MTVFSPRVALVVCVALGPALAARGDWPMLRGNAQHTGFVRADLQRPFRLAWVREIERERLGTVMEPIVADGRLFLATHSGNVYALDAESGKPLWRFTSHGPFLHSPAVAGGLLLAASTDGNLYAVEAGTGKLVWQWFGGDGGFSASPTVADQTVYLGTRAGDFAAIQLATGQLAWRQMLNVPLRQTAAVADGHVFVTGEDLGVRCLNAKDGQLLWTSAPLAGQTARDYYPIVIQQPGRTLVIVRTNPVLNMGQRIGRDRSLLCRNAGVDNSGWQQVEAWTKSEQARGNAELWTREQNAIARYLETNRDACTFFVLDGKTGKEAFTAPVLWVAGCQGVGAQPALTADGRLLVFYRSAYGNWNHGVAPLVSLGLLDLGQNQISPLFHQQGRQPLWNCFWGTADESQNFVVAGDTALLVHQATLSGFDLRKSELFPIWGERDTYGGFRSPPWARNEWHGPARSGVAVVGRRLYWQTGSRVLCLVSGERAPGGEAVRPRIIRAQDVTGQVASPVPGQSVLAGPTNREGEAPAEPLAARGSASDSLTRSPPVLLTAQDRPDASRIRQRLRAAVQELLSRTWAPLWTDPGLAGRVISFDRSDELFEALAWAYPHLPTEAQQQAKRLLKDQWVSHPPFAKEAWYSLQEGTPREWFWVPDDFRSRLGSDRQPRPFGGVYAAWLFGERCGEDKLILASWPKLKAAFEQFLQSGWRLDPTQGDAFANRYLAGLLAIRRLAEKVGDQVTAQQASAKAGETTVALAAWWQRAAEIGTLRNFQGSAELDPFIHKGDGISLAVAPHRHKLALFQDLTPEIAELLKAQAPEAVAGVRQIFQTLYRTWWLMGEERQVHFGENFVDPPDLALSGYRSLIWLGDASADELSRCTDLPFCRADLYYIMKLSMLMEKMGR
ncbi:MAG: PQQ-binding-like beta-propeller repeat protein [Planctomycetota bacterium]|nr:PQQ-binding-like beta-propeller repeat protein [Planctomycetota bacterium]